MSTRVILLNGDKRVVYVTPVYGPSYFTYEESCGTDALGVLRWQAIDVSGETPKGVQDWLDCMANKIDALQGRKDVRGDNS